MSQLFVSCKDWFSWLNHFYVSNANYIINNWKVSSRHFPLVNILVGLLFNYQDLSVMWKRFWWFKRIRNFLAIREKKLQIKLSGVVALITVVIGNFHPNWTFSHASNVQQEFAVYSHGDNISSSFSCLFFKRTYKMMESEVCSWKYFH